MEMLPSLRLMQKKAALTKWPTSQAELSVLCKYEQQDWHALFASPTQLQALRLLASTVRNPQRDIMRRHEQEDQRVQYEQQDWQAAQESDRLFPLPLQARC